MQEADLVHGGCEPQDKLSASGVRAGRSTALRPYLAEREMCLAKQGGNRTEIENTAVHTFSSETNKKSPRKSTFWNCWVRGNETFCSDSDVLFLNYLFLI